MRSRCPTPRFEWNPSIWLCNVILDYPPLGAKGWVGVHLSGVSLTNTCPQLEWLKLCVIFSELLLAFLHTKGDLNTPKHWRVANFNLKNILNCYISRQMSPAGNSGEPMLRSVHSKINFSLNLFRVVLRIFPIKDEIIVHHLQIFKRFFDRPLFFNRFFKRLKYTSLPPAPSAKFSLFKKNRKQI